MCIPRELASVKTGSRQNSKMTERQNLTLVIHEIECVVGWIRVVCLWISLIFKVNQGLVGINWVCLGFGAFEIDHSPL